MSFVEAVGPAAFVTYVRAVLLRDTGACISQGTIRLSIGCEHIDDITCDLEKGFDAAAAIAK